MIDSRVGRDGSEIRRRRECLECTRRFTTRERIDEVMPKIVKRDQRREEFRREKLLTALQKASEKRPVSAHALEQLVDRVERRLQEFGEKEVTSRYVGDRVMEELLRLDHLAAARFASVFRNFEAAEDYTEFFASIQGSKTERR